MLHIGATLGIELQCFYTMLFITVVTVFTVKSQWPQWIHAYKHVSTVAKCTQNRSQDSYLKSCHKKGPQPSNSGLEIYRETFTQNICLMVRSGYCTMPHFLALLCT